MPQGEVLHIVAFSPLIINLWVYTWRHKSQCSCQCVPLSWGHYICFLACFCVEYLTKYARNLCLSVCLSVLQLSWQPFIRLTSHCGECIAEGPLKCCFECEVVWMSGSWESCMHQYWRPSSRPVLNGHVLNGQCTSSYNTKEIKVLKSVFLKLILGSSEFSF